MSWASEVFCQHLAQRRRVQHLLTVGGETFVVQGEPEGRDPDRLVWTLDARQAYDRLGPGTASQVVRLTWAPVTEGHAMHLAATSSGYGRVLSLCEVTGQELDRRYRASGPGALPAGPVTGAIMLLPGTPLARPIAHLVRALAWQGKVFHADRGELVNRILLFRINAVRAKVREGRSWFDGRPCIVLDYSETSLLASMVRDEIREIETGLWLGLAYMWRTRVLRFALAGEVARHPTADAPCL